MNFFIYSLGCKLNQAESLLLAADFLSAGWQQVKDVGEADVIILNVCAVTIKAEKESRQKVSSVRHKNKKALLVVTGCFVKANWPGVDLWFDNEQKLKELLKQVTEKLGPVVDQRANGQLAQVINRTRALIKIQTGCNNFCSYCIVPYLRGHNQSVPITEVVSEVKKRVNEGFKEVVLTGVHIGSYLKDMKIDGGLCQLLKKILKQTAIERIRLGSLWPTDVTTELIDLMAGQTRICNHLHLSVQAGSDKVLKLMNRKYNLAQVWHIVDEARKKINGLNLTADLIVGFIGEEDDDFEQSLTLIKRAGFAKVHIFRFAERPGTKAIEFNLPKVSEAQKKMRAKKAAIVASRAGLKIKQNFLNRKVNVLWESEVGGYVQGYSSNYFLVRKKRAVLNQVETVKLKSLKKGVFYS